MSRAFSLLLAAMLLALAQPAPAQTVQRIAAVVNEDIISAQDLEERLRLAIITSGLQDQAEIRERLGPQVLRGLIDETLQLQEADRLGIVVYDDEIDQALDTIAGRNDMTRSQLAGFLARDGISEHTLRRQLEAQVAWLKVVGREIRPRVTISEEQVNMALRELRQAGDQAELLLAEIVLPVYEQDQEAAVAGDAQRIVDAIRQGAGFAAVAGQFSASPSAEVGGDIGWVPESAIPPDLRSHLATMRPGEVSDPVRVQAGYYILLLRERRQAMPAGVAEQRVALAQILFPLPGDAGNGAALASLEERAAALRPRLASCDDMGRVAEEIDAPLSGELGWLRIRDLPTNLAEAVLALPDATVSAPLRGPAGIHLLMVCEREEPAAGDDDREEIIAQLEREQIDRWVRRYLRDLRMEAFIDVRL